jgi:hypothetical protein
MSENLGTKAQYAARGIKNPDDTFRQVSKAYLSKAGVKEMLEGALVQDPNNSNKKLLDFDKADELFAKNADAARAEVVAKRNAAGNGKSNPEDEDTGEATYTQIRNNKELAKLEQVRLDLLERKAETISRQSVLDATAAAGQKIQEHLRACSRRLSEKVATMTDAREIKTVIDEEIRRTLETVSDDLERKLNPQGETASTATN